MRQGGEMLSGMQINIWQYSSLQFAYFCFVRTFRILLPAIVLFCVVFSGCGGNRIEGGGSNPMGGSSPGAPSAGRSEATTSHSEPQFVKEGELQFLSADGKDTLSAIQIEVAATDAEREQGLMFRTTIEESTGMLFLFDQADYQSFWMKNTPSSLDILFISPDNRIVNIHKYTSPYSTEGLPSSARADKVVEVKGGYTDKFKISPGCRIQYKLTL